jgi:hypothetical protein
VRCIEIIAAIAKIPSALAMLPDIRPGNDVVAAQLNYLNIPAKVAEEDMSRFGGLGSGETTIFAN